MPNDRGIRVRVWSGDQAEHLGLGRLVGRVTVWYWIMPIPEYHLSSLTMAEEKPSTDEQELMEALGGILRSDPGNPKIVLDNGRVVGSLRLPGVVESGSRRRARRAPRDD